MSTVGSLIKLFDSELHSSLKDVLVTCNNRGQYTLFNRYLVSPTNDGLYIAIDSVTKEKLEFSALKNAITWCTLHNSKQWFDARRLQTLDLKLSSLNMDIAVHRRILKQTNEHGAKIICLTKLQEDSYKRRQTVAEINSLINSSKRIQDTNFSKIKERKFVFK